MTLLRPSIFSMRNIQKIHAPSRKIFPKNHCYFSGSRIYWEVYRSSLPAPQAGELSSCTAASGGKQAGKAILPSPPFFAVFLFCRYSYFQRWHCSVFSLSRLCYRSGTCAFGTAAGPAFALLRLLLLARYSPVSDSVIGMNPAFSRRCYHLGSCFFSVPIICRYFLFFGIDSSPELGSFFSAGVPFLDFRGGCFYPFGFLRCRFFGLHPPVLSSYCPIF